MAAASVWSEAGKPAWRSGDWVADNDGVAGETDESLVDLEGVAHAGAFDGVGGRQGGGVVVEELGGDGEWVIYGIGVYGFG